MDLGEFEKWLAEGQGRIINKFETETYLKVNSVMSSAAKNTAPVREKNGGFLRDTIDTYGHVEATPEDVTMAITANAEYAIFVEFGTGQRGDPSVPHRPDWPGMKAQHFMRDAMNATTEEAKEILAKDAVEALNND